MANFYGELVVRITSDTAGLKKGLTESAAGVSALGDKTAKSSRSMAARMEHVGRQMQNVGRQMTQFVTLPIAAGFAVAAVAAFKFEDSLMKIQNLTGTNAAQTKAWGDELLKLGAATGQTPLKLAEALYFVASSGFKGAEAMKVIEVSAKAAAAGMGDVMVTADVLTSAMNAYGHQAYTAAEVTDYLMKTIEVGKAEPTALASSLGRIMPVAAQLKVGLDELGGNVAALTLGGLSSAEAVTALRGTMMALVAPAKMSIDELKTMGLSFQEVTDSIAKKGLLPTLKMLWERTDHNMLSMRKIIPNVRALNGVLSLLGANYQTNLEVIDKVANAHGALDKAMKNTAQQPIQRLRQAWASLQGSFIKIGSVLLPVLADIAKWLAKVAESFSKMSPGWRNLILGALAFAAAIGPVVMITGTLVNSLGLLLPLLTRVGAGMGALGGGGGAISLLPGAVPAAGWAARFGAILAPMAAGIGVAVPAVAIAAVLATAVTKAIDAGMEKAAENSKRRAMTGDAWGLDDFLSETKAGVDAAGNFFSKPLVDFMNSDFMTGRSAMAAKDAFAAAAVALAKLGKAGGIAATQVRYLREDLGALVQNPQILGDMNVEKSVAQMKKWRTAVMEHLKVSKKEAEAVLRTMFGPDVAFSGKQWRAMNSGIEGATSRVAKLKAELARATAFKDLPLMTSLNKQLEKAEAKLARLQTRDLRKSFARQANTVGLPLPDWTKAGAGGLRVPVPQWQGKMRFPKVDVGGAKVAVQGLGKYLDLVVKSRKITITAKVQTVQAVLKGVNARLKEIGDKPKTAKLRAEKSGLEAVAKAARTILNTYRDRKNETKLTANNDQAMGAIEEVNTALANMQDKTVRIFVSKVPIDKDAWGGLYTKPRVTLVGEDGPEVILPLNKPARMLSLMRKAGIAHLASQASPARPAPAMRAAASTSPVEIHHHYHSTVSIPGGTIVDQPQRLADRLSPYQAANMRTAQRRRQRGVATL
jgi:TP901 family phage tail tape measure protein